MSKPKDERALSHCDGCGEDLPAREVTAYFHKLKSATPPQLVDVRASIHLCEDCAKNASGCLSACLGASFKGFESDEITNPKEWNELVSWLHDEPSWKANRDDQVASWEAEVKANPPQRVALAPLTELQEFLLNLLTALNEWCSDRDPDLEELDSFRTRTEKLLAQSTPEQSTQAGEAQIKTDPPAQDHPRTLFALIELAGGPGAFIMDRAMPCPVIAHTAHSFRFICAACDVAPLEQCLLQGGETIKSVSFLTLQEQNPIPTPPK